MITFSVFDEHGLDSDWLLRHAHLLGADDVVAPGRVTFADGLIRCVPQEAGSTALALQMDIGPMGVLTLRTCLLPHRDKPYLLSLELARHQIMQLFVKLEEWSEFDRPASDPVMTLFNQAREKFTIALIMEPDPETGGSPQEDQSARQALELALEAGERLTIAHACAALDAKINPSVDDQSPEQPDSPDQAAPSLSKGADVRPTIGMSISPARFTEPLQQAITDSADFINLPMRWSDLEADEGVYAFGPFDRWIEWAVRTGKMPVVAGPIIDLRPGCVPDWLYIWENDYDTLRELIYEHVKRIVTRYRRTVSNWVVASGLHVAGNFSLSLEQVIDLTRICVLIVRKLHPRANIRIEIAQPFGEYAARNTVSLAPQLYAEIIAQAGIGVDGFGLQLLMGDVAPGRSARDLMAIADLIDRYAEFQKPLSISLLGAPGVSPDLAATGYGEMDPGYWREPWSPQSQADWLAHVAVVALGHPAVSSVCWQALYDTGSDVDMHAGGLIDAAGQVRPSLAALKTIHNHIRHNTPLGDLLRSDLVQPVGAK